MPRAGLIALVVMLMAGCAGSTSVSVDRYVLMDPSNSPGVPFEQASVRLQMGNVEVAPVLQQRGIVFQTEERKLTVARRNRWAEPLSDQLRGSLYSLLTRSFDSVAVIKDGPAISGTTWTMTADVDAFHGRFDGYGVVQGTWWLQDPDGNLVVRQGFDEKVPLESDGYDALVDALSEGWQRVGTSIVEHSRRTFETRSRLNGEIGRNGS